jgi:hypothetical protein
MRIAMKIELKVLIGGENCPVRIAPSSHPASNLRIEPVLTF